MGHLGKSSSLPEIHSTLLAIYASSRTINKIRRGLSLNPGNYLIVRPFWRPRLAPGHPSNRSSPGQRSATVVAQEAGPGSRHPDHLRQVVPVILTPARLYAVCNRSL
jgi:hypothetical protein